MKQHPVHLLDPVFRWLDEMIQEHGDALYMWLVYASIPLIGWFLFGRSRRKSARAEQTPPVIVIHVPVEHHTPPPEPFDPFPAYQEPPCCDHDDYHRD